MEKRDGPVIPTGRLVDWRVLALSLLAVLVTIATIMGVIATLPSASGPPSRGSHGTPSASQQRPTPTATPQPTILAENALPGTSRWLIPAGHAATVELQAYASATSASAGDSIAFYVSTQTAGTPYTVDFYRLGWYGGAGARLLFSERETGQVQGYYDWSHFRLVGCQSCLLDPTTRRMEADWQPSFQLTIPDSWPTGLYVAKLTDASGKQFYVHFTVRGNPISPYIVVIPDNTTEAYNDWGGYSLYHGPNGSFGTRATKVSFDRPALGWRFGYGNGLSYEIDAIRWLERQGYDLSYISSVDLHEHPEQLLQHRAFLSIGHDEYWSKAMRDGVEHARDAGVGLAFLGANAAYWQVRFEPDSNGIADRTLVCYKDMRSDPLFGKNNALVTVNWRDWPLSRPENALIGVMYVDYVNPPHAYPWHMDPAASSSLLAGTGLQPGQMYGCDLVGYEWDQVYDNGHTPRNLHVLATSPAISVAGRAEHSNTAYYVADSGAFVFASGSIYWSYALDDLRIWDVPQPTPTGPCTAPGQSVAVPGIQALMVHVMDALVVHHVAGEM